MGSRALPARHPPACAARSPDRGSHARGERCDAGCPCCGARRAHGARASKTCSSRQHSAVAPRLAQAAEGGLMSALAEAWGRISAVAAKEFRQPGATASPSAWWSAFRCCRSDFRLQHQFRRAPHRGRSGGPGTDDGFARVRRAARGKPGHRSHPPLRLTARPATRDRQWGNQRRHLHTAGLRAPPAGSGTRGGTDPGRRRRTRNRRGGARPCRRAPAAARGGEYAASASG